MGGVLLFLNISMTFVSFCCCVGTPLLVLVVREYHRCRNSNTQISNLLKLALCSIFMPIVKNVLCTQSVTMKYAIDNQLYKRDLNEDRSYIYNNRLFEKYVDDIYLVYLSIFH